MKILILTLLLILYVNAAEKAVPVKYSWKSLKSENGFEVKYPDCWSLIVDDAYDNSSVEKTSDLGIVEGSKCARPKNNPNIPNMVSIRSWKELKSVAEIDDKIKQMVKRYSKESADSLGAASMHIGDEKAVVYVDNIGSATIRWNINIYCQNLQTLTIQAASLHESSRLYAEYLKRVQSGDLSMPAPEKTILESIRCIPVTLKPKR